jgi:glucose-6-phosphate dehydrogenase assembly protein OpcA
VTAATASSITPIGSWESDGVAVSQVERALASIRHHERRAAVRTSVLTLVVVVGDDGAAASAREVVADLGARHPSRTIVLVIGDGDDGDNAASGIDAAASVHCAERDNTAVCFEDVVLRVRGEARYHLDSVVEPLTLPDLPVVVWLPSRLPSPGDPLLAIADRIVVDSRAVAEESSTDRHTVIPRIAALSRRLPVTDLSWQRLGTWRQMLASLFEGAVFRPFLQQVDALEVAGHFGPRHLLGGWVLRRLAVPAARAHLSPADHVSIRIVARHGGQKGVFAVERPGPERVVQASVEIDDGPCLAQTVQLRRQWPSLALAGALTRMGRDEAYREALRGAVALLPAEAR